MRQTIPRMARGKGQLEQGKKENKCQMNDFEKRAKVGIENTFSPSVLLAMILDNSPPKFDRHRRTLEAVVRRAMINLKVNVY
jgi:hypothetical protein